jgi:hypothetical protein
MAEEVTDRFGRVIRPGDLIVYALGCGRSSGCQFLYMVTKAETYLDKEWVYNDTQRDENGRRIGHYEDVPKIRLVGRQLDANGEGEWDEISRQRIDRPPYKAAKAVALRDHLAAIVITDADFGPDFRKELERYEEYDRLNAEAGFGPVRPASDPAPRWRSSVPEDYQI